MRINSPYWAAQPIRGQRGCPVPFSVRSTGRYLVPSSKDRTCHQAHFLEEKLNKNRYKINHNFPTSKNFKGISDMQHRSGKNLYHSPFLILSVVMKSDTNVLVIEMAFVFCFLQTLFTIILPSESLWKSNEETTPKNTYFIVWCLDWTMG